MNLKNPAISNIILILIFPLVIETSCTTESNNFQTFDFDPIKLALKENKITYYESFTTQGDSTLKLYSYKIDENGNLQSNDAIGVIFDGSHDTFKYDSVGHLTEAIYRSDVESKYLITYKLFPKEKKVIERCTWSHWFHTTNIFVYDDQLQKIIEKITLNETEDTISHLKFKYYHEKIIGVSEKGKPKIIYDYDDFGNLKIIKHISGETDYKVDYISTKTGLIDSTLECRMGRMEYPVYYNYFNTN